MGKKFRFIHVADPHVGHSGNASRYNEYRSLRINKFTPEGINVRQDDINKAFTQVIDLAIEHEVDMVINAGDGWDFWGYKQPIVENFYTYQVSRLYRSGIKYLEIVGNHNLPKHAGKGCHLETLGLFPEVYVSYRGFYEYYDFPEHNVVVHCVPSTFTQEILDDSVSQVEPIEGRINIGVGHFGVTAIKHYAENAINSLVIDLDRLIACNMDYFALGDYHTPTDFGFNIRYAGSIERFGFDEIDNIPQVLLVEIDEETKEVEVKPLLLDVRPMIEIPSVDAKGKTIDDINAEIIDKLKKYDLKDKIVRFKIRNLPTHIKKLIDDKTIKELTEEALFFRLELVDKVNKTKEAKTGDKKFSSVLESWDSFADSIEDDGSFDKAELKKEGKEGLMEVYEDEAI